MTNIQQDVTYVLVQSPLKTSFGQKNAKSITTQILISSITITQSKSFMNSQPLSKK
jgi:hypothetical protein